MNADLRAARDRAFEAMRDAAIDLADVSIGTRHGRDIERLRETYREAVAAYEAARLAALESEAA